MPDESLYFTSYQSYIEVVIDFDLRSDLEQSIFCAHVHKWISKTERRHQFHPFVHPVPNWPGLFYHTKDVSCDSSNTRKNEMKEDSDCLGYGVRLKNEGCHIGEGDDTDRVKQENSPHIIVEKVES